MKFVLILFSTLLFAPTIFKAQDSTYSAPSLTKAFIVSSTLMTAGVITNEKGIKEDFREWVRNQ